MFTEENESESDTDTVSSKKKKVKKTIKPRKVVDVVYLNNLSTVYVVKTLKQKYEGEYSPCDPLP